jgi:hypothetical protein
VETITDKTLILYEKFAWPHAMDILVGIEKDTEIFVLTLFVTCFHAGSLLGLYFKPEDGGAMLLVNFGHYISEDRTFECFCFVFNSHT